MQELLVSTVLRKFLSLFRYKSMLPINRLYNITLKIRDSSDYIEFESTPFAARIFQDKYEHSMSGEQES